MCLTCSPPAFGHEGDPRTSPALNLQPRRRPRLAGRRAPVRPRASYRPTGGVRHMIAALDRIRPQARSSTGSGRERWREFLAFFELLPQRWPEQKLHVILDNSSPHKHPGLPAGPPPRRKLAELLESEFAAPRYFRQRHRSPDPRRSRRRDRPIPELAQRPRPAQARLRPGSVIRSSIDYQINVA